MKYLILFLLSLRAIASTYSVSHTFKETDDFTFKPFPSHLGTVDSTTISVVAETEAKAQIKTGHAANSGYFQDISRVFVHWGTEDYIFLAPTAGFTYDLGPCQSVVLHGEDEQVQEDHPVYNSGPYTVSVDITTTEEPPPSDYVTVKEQVKNRVEVTITYTYTPLHP